MQHFSGHLPNLIIIVSLLGLRLGLLDVRPDCFCQTRVVGSVYNSEPHKRMLTKGKYLSSFVPFLDYCCLFCRIFGSFQYKKEQKSNVFLLIFVVMRSPEIGYYCLPVKGANYLDKSLICIASNLDILSVLTSQEYLRPVRKLCVYSLLMTKQISACLCITT